MSTQVGRRHIYGLATVTIAIGTITGYISPNVQTIKGTHTGDVERIKSAVGAIGSLISSGDEKFECAFDFIPENPDLNAIANPSAALPVILSFVTITGIEPIHVGAFGADAFNSPLWIYEGGGAIHGESAKHWTASFTLHRYLGITSATVITAG